MLPWGLPSVVGGLKFRWRDVADWFQQPAVVEPVVHGGSSVRSGAASATAARPSGRGSLAGYHSAGKGALVLHNSEPPVAPNANSNGAPRRPEPAGGGHRRRPDRFDRIGNRRPTRLDRARRTWKPSCKRARSSAGNSPMDSLGGTTTIYRPMAMAGPALPPRLVRVPIIQDPASWPCEMPCRRGRGRGAPDGSA
jgi:hypothetical protein